MTPNCDFCGDETTKEALVIIPTKTFVIARINYINQSWGWGMCEACAPLWGDDLTALLNRAVSHHPHGEIVRDHLALIYAGIKENQNGPLRGWHPMDEGGP